MSLWQRLRRAGATPQAPECHTVLLAAPDWREEAATGSLLRVWRDSQGDVLSLSVQPSLGLPELSNQGAIQSYGRDITESRQAGLIEVRVVTSTIGVSVGVIFKRLQNPAYIFTGMLLVPRQQGSQVWTVVAELPAWIVESRPLN